MQSKTSKILAIIGSILLAGLIAFMVVWTVINWDVIKTTFDGSKIYTTEDVNNAYQDGYNSGSVDKEYYENLINEYREQISNYAAQIGELTGQINQLDNNNKDYAIQLEILTEQLDEAQIQIKYYQ